MYKNYMFLESKMVNIYRYSSIYLFFVKFILTQSMFNLRTRYTVYLIPIYRNIIKSIIYITFDEEMFNGY
jgi:hypothetical protein